MEHVRSPYAPPFKALAAEVQQDAAVASSNARFLAILEAPCNALGQAAPKVGQPLCLEAAAKGQLLEGWQCRKHWLHCQLPCS